MDSSCRILNFLVWKSTRSTVLYVCWFCFVCIFRLKVLSFASFQQTWKDLLAAAQQPYLTAAVLFILTILSEHLLDYQLEVNHPTLSVLKLSSAGQDKSGSSAHPPQRDQMQGLKLCGKFRYWSTTLVDLKIRSP